MAGSENREEQPKPIAPQDNASNEGGDGTPVRPPVPPNIPPSPTDPANPHQGDRRRKPVLQTILEIIGVCAAVALVIITGFYTHYAQQQRDAIIKSNGISQHGVCAATKAAKAAEEANRVTKIALIDVQRAFVFLGDVTATVIGNNTVDFYFPMENSGTTPTKDMRLHISYQWGPKPLPDNFDFPDLWSPGSPHVNRHTLLSPKGKIGQHVGPISLPIVQAAIHRQTHLYFWGWAKYHDVFQDTPLHVTKFCSEFVPLGQGEESAPAVTMLRFTLEMCERHNCYDEECRNKQAGALPSLPN
jgi:hypothetical protein